jgi:hypothetical protein
LQENLEIQVYTPLQKGAQYCPSREKGGEEGESSGAGKAAGSQASGRVRASAREATGALWQLWGGMLVPTDKLQDIYDHIKHKVQAVDGSGSVLICSAGETDAIAGCHILMVCRATPLLSVCTRSVRNCSLQCEPLCSDASFGQPPSTASS